MTRPGIEPRFPDHRRKIYPLEHLAPKVKSFFALNNLLTGPFLKSLTLARDRFSLYGWSCCNRLLFVGPITGYQVHLRWGAPSKLHDPRFSPVNNLLCTIIWSFPVQFIIIIGLHWESTAFPTYFLSSIHIYQPLCSGRIWHKVNF